MIISYSVIVLRCNIQQIFMNNMYNLWRLHESFIFLWNIVLRLFQNKDKEMYVYNSV